MKTPVILKYFARYWFLLVIAALFVALALSNTLFNAAGTLVYLPILVIGAALVALLLRNVLNHDTSDDDADTGRFAAEWKALDARTRVILTVVQFIAYFLGACWVASALVR